MISKLTLVALMSLVVVAMFQSDTTVSVPPPPVNVTVTTDKTSEEGVRLEPSRGPELPSVQASTDPPPAANQEEEHHPQQENQNVEKDAQTSPTEAPKQENSQDLARLAYGQLPDG